MEDAALNGLQSGRLRKSIFHVIGYFITTPKHCLVLLLPSYCIIIIIALDWATMAGG